MKLISNSLSLAKTCAVTTAAFTMVMAPVAQGANSKMSAQINAKPRVQSVGEGVDYNIDKKAIQSYLKYTGLSGKKRISVGEYWAKMRPYYPKTLQRDMERWVLLNRNELMPEFEASTYKDADGKEHVRLLMSKDGQTVTASFNPESNGKFVKVNNVYLTKDDMLYHEQAFRKVAHGDKAIKASLLKAPKLKPLKKSIVLSYEEFNRLTPRQRAEYFVRLRYVTENAQRVFKTYYGDQAMNSFNKDFFVQWLLGQDANAKAIKGAKPGDPCIVSGYMSVYGENFSCGGMARGTKDLRQQMEKFGGGKCSGGTVSCNPLVYGYKADGAAFCVSTANAKVNGGIRDATSNFCKNASPLRKGTQFEAEDKKRIIESFMASKGQAIDLKFDKDGKVSKEQYDLVKDYLADLNSYIDKATLTCQTAPLSEIKTVRDEQNSACVALATRKMDLLSYPAAPVVIPPPIAETDCSTIKPGAVAPECVSCPPDMVDGTINEDGQERPACVVAAVAAVGAETKKECNKDQKRDEKTDECEALCNWWCLNGKWVIGGAVIAGIIGAIWWLTNDDDDDHRKPTAVDPCPPAPLICTPVVTPPAATPPPVTEPPPITTTTPSPTPAEPIPTPVATPYLESTSGVSTSTSGGAR